MPRITPNRSLSTWLLALALAIGISSLVPLLPWALIRKGLPSGALEWATTLSGLLAGPGAVIAWWIARMRRMRTSGTLVDQCDRLHDDEVTALQEVRSVVGPDIFQQFVFCQRGKATEVVDDGHALEESPDAQYAAENGRTKAVIRIPAGFLLRFRDHPKALVASILHEMAHFINRDLAWFLEVRAGLVCLAWAETVHLSVSCVKTAADAAGYAGSNNVANMLISVVAHSYNLTVLGALAFVMACVRRLGRWREALADQFVQDQGYSKALSQAEHLIAGPTPGGVRAVRPSPRSRRRAGILGDREVFFLGAFASAVAAFIAVPANYLFVSSSPKWITWTVVSSAVSGMAQYAVCFLGALIVAQVIGTRHPASARVMAFRAVRASALMISGIVVAHVLLICTPLVAVSTLSSGPASSHLTKYHVTPLLVQGVCWGLASGALSLWLTVPSLTLTRSAKNWWLGLLPGVCWFGVSALEELWWAPWTFGTAAFGLTALVSIVGIVSDRRSHAWARDVSFRRAWPAICLIIVASLTGLLGYGEIGHWTRSLDAAGQSRYIKGDIEGSVRCFTASAWASHPYADQWIRLADAKGSTRSGTQLDDAIADAERAVDAPLLASKPVECAATELLAALLLKRNGADDVAHAYRVLKLAEAEYRDCSVVQDRVAFELLYNLACVTAAFQNDDREATLLLSEAAGIAPDKAISALDDQDLASLALRKQPAPDRLSLRRFREMGTTNRAFIDAALQEGWLTHAELRRCLAHLLLEWERRPREAAGH